MDIGSWISLAGLVLVIIGIAVKSGELKRTVAELEKRDSDQATEIKTLATKVELAEVNMRQKEDRDKNDERFKELYVSRNQHEALLTAVSTNMANLVGAIDSLKSDFRASVTELKDDIRNAKCS